ncbi:hypothetical protein JHK82_012268 [Glycine max]|nr:hypothetical protein JHK85_012612 [Glycine max]KAG5057277.1 hypothetical protein JHK86_012273 [Glycine max]KAG5154299.1 hypothetical protein JHK82_012268 [Glycine max]
MVSISASNKTLAIFKQQIDRSNHDMVNTLTNHMASILNPFLRTTNECYQQMNGESLVKFMSKKQKAGKEVMLCPRYNTMFDRSAAKAFKALEFRKSFQKIQEIDVQEKEKQNLSSPGLASGLLGPPNNFMVKKPTRWGEPIALALSFISPGRATFAPITNSDMNNESHSACKYIFEA